MTHVLLIEDDSAIRLPLLRALRERDFEVSEASCGLKGLQLLVDNPPDVVVLDLGLPDIGGQELLRMLRSVSNVPVIVATARDDELDVVRVLNAGADDYVVKPFSAAQIEARCRAVLRRGNDVRRTAESDEREALRIGDLVLDPAARHATLAGEVLSLSRKEFDVLQFLAERPGVVVTKQELLAVVWKQPVLGSEKTVDTHLSWLRAKLGETATAPRFLHTVRGVGVKLTDPDEAG